MGSFEDQLTITIKDDLDHLMAALVTKQVRRVRRQWSCWENAKALMGCFWTKLRSVIIARKVDANSLSFYGLTILCTVVDFRSRDPSKADLLVRPITEAIANKFVYFV